jgi:hypothetical protein
MFNFVPFRQSWFALDGSTLQARLEIFLLASSPCASTGLLLGLSDRLRSDLWRPARTFQILQTFICRCWICREDSNQKNCEENSEKSEVRPLLIHKDLEAYLARLPPNFIFRPLLQSSHTVPNAGLWED